MLKMCTFGGTWNLSDLCDYSQWRQTTNNMGICLTFNSKHYIAQHGRLQSVRGGVSYGLSVVVNVDVDEYVYAQKHFDGIKVFAAFMHVLMKSKCIQTYYFGIFFYHWINFRDIEYM